jgi:hypothetical protein
MRGENVDITCFYAPEGADITELLQQSFASFLKKELNQPSKSVILDDSEWPLISEVHKCTQR